MFGWFLVSGFEFQKLETRNQKLSKLGTASDDLSRGHPIFLRAPANHGAHVTGRAGFRQGRLEDLMNFWILVFVFDLISTLLHVHLDGLFVGERDKSVAPAIPAQGEITSGFGAGVKMLVTPLVRRLDHAPRFPVDAHHFAVVGGPKQGIALTA